MPEPLILKDEYPTPEWLGADAYSLAVISPAYASPTGELNAILQYFYHYFNFDHCGYREIADTLQRIAIAEMLHFKLLGRAIIALGAQPIYCQNPPTGFNFYSTKSVIYSKEPVHMIEDDILGEKHAVAQYTKMLCRLKNDHLKKLVTRIRADEELHIETLNGILKDLKC